MTREALAFHSGLSFAAIAQIESGRRQDVRLATLVSLARALGVSVDYLVAPSAVGPKLFRHRVLMYHSDQEYLASTLPFLLEGLRRNEDALAVTTGRKAKLLRDVLGGDADRVEFRDSAEWYASPLHALSNYRSFAEGCLQHGARWIRIIGDPVWAGWSAAEVATWTRYESMINLSMASTPATIICPYDTRIASPDVLADARHTHPEVVTADDVAISKDYREPEHFLLDLL